MKVLVIDNYDSFTFNLVQLIGQFIPNIVVARNDKITIDEIKDLSPDKIVISPGPGNPQDSNISLDVIKILGLNTPVLGVCLGHQGIGHVFGAKITNAPTLMHGKTSLINHDNQRVYKNIEQKFEAARYHSLIIEKTSLPDELYVTSETDDGVIMGVRHKQFPIEGIQFHPESVLTKVGDQLIKNWLGI